MRRFCLALHTQGQVTTERLTDLLNGIGLSISKREVVRLLTTDLEPFAQEDHAILQAGLTSSPYITVDDTGARHARRPGVTTQIGGERFCVFRTSRSKSRLNFLSLLRGGREDYVVNEAALDYLRRQPVEAAVIARLTTLQGHVFRSQMDWLEHVARCSINIFDRPLLQTLNEAATWGAIRHHGLMENTVVVSDDAGQFRVATACPVLGSCRAAPAEADAGLAQAGPGGGIGPQDDLVLLPRSEAVEAKPLTGR